MEAWGRRFGRPHKLLVNRPYLPGELVWLHNAYMEIARRRSYDAMGNPQLLTFHDLLVYAKHVQQISPELTPTFIRILAEVDEEVLSDYYTKRREKEDREEKIKKASN